MWAYIIRRTLWTVPIVLGIVLITFVLFTYVAPDPARLKVGKNATPDKLEAARRKMGLDKPVWFDFGAFGRKGPARYPAPTAKSEPATQPTTAPTTEPFDDSAGGEDEGGDEGPLPPRRRPSGWAGFFDTQFFDVLLWKMPESEHYHETLWNLVKAKGPVSLSIQGPVFIIELGVQLVLALLCARYRGRWPDYVITLVAVLGMCVPVLSIIILFQWLLGFKMGLFPVVGWGVWPGVISYAVLPIIIGVVTQVGSGVRFYRTVMVEEVHQDYVRTARAKGVGGAQVLLTHVLRNGLIPVITNTVATLPYLLLGAWLLERMFQIPGLGYILVEGISNEDRSVVLGLTYGISVVYCIMLLLTDICYTLVDPRVRLA